MPETDMIAIAIPSYRRPDGLARCLRAISELKTSGRRLRVIVADNDAERRDATGVCDRLRAEGYRLPLTSILVAERGIAAARNALVREALADPDVELIAMIDDDEWPRPDWLNDIAKVRDSYAADVVGGPVVRHYEIEPASHVRAASEGRYGNLETGPVDLVDATSNILFRAKLFRERPDPWFDPSYGLIGGEDKELLVRLKMEGISFAWAKDAIVEESYPASRCSLGWMLRRSYRSGNSDMLINLKNRPRSFSAMGEFAKIVGGAGVGLLDVTLLGWRPQRRFKGLLLLARIGGKLAALLGLRYREYQVVHGS